VLSKDEQAKLSPAAFSKQASEYLSQSLRTPLGEPFRQKFARSVCVIIFGAPYSKKANIIHASRAISALCAHSLKEDDYAQVSKSVALVIGTYVDTIRSIQTFTQNATPDWTDVYFTDHDRAIPEVEELVKVLKQGLEQIVLVFGEYQSSIGITKKELREAKELVGKGQEMTTR
jgi:nucleoporin NDC1